MTNPDLQQDVPFDDPVVESAPAGPAKTNGNHPGESFENATPVPVAELRRGSPGPAQNNDALRGSHAVLATRTLPNDIEAEEYLLSSILIDGPEVMASAKVAKIQPDSFYHPQNAICFDALLRMEANDVPIEAATLAQQLRTTNQLDAVGGFAFITQISGRVSTTAGARAFIKTVSALAKRREIIRAALQTYEDAHDTAIDLPEITDSLRRRVDFAIMGPRGAELWPEPVRASELCVNKPVKPPVLIEGMLYMVGTMLLSGPSKSHKTFSCLDAGISIAAGEPWLGHATTQAPVLYLNLELQDFATEDRIERISRARGIQPPKDLHVWNLRGRTVTLDQLTVRLPEQIKKSGAKVVCIDPHYKVSAVSDMEENSNDAQGKLLTLMEGICAQNGAALLLTHHFAKGDASQKNAIDRASGGGVFARWGDVMLTFTPHESDDAMSVEMSLRNFAPVEPFVVRWIYPRWVRDDDLDPGKLKTSRGPKEKHTSKSLVYALGGAMLTYSQWEKASGMSPTTFKRKRQELLDAGLVTQVGELYRKTED